MRFLRAIAILSGTVLAPIPGLAQPAAPAEAPPVAPGTAKDTTAPDPTDCAPKGALYQAGKGTKVWVVRQGTMVLAENPLRPLSRDEAVVLEVVVNGRRATAYGPDLHHLRQGGSAKSVEREGRGPIRWAEGSVAPPAIRVIAEDGRVLLGPMPFGGCEDVPTAKTVADKPVPAEKPAKGKRKPKAAAAAEDGPMPRQLPQGAIDGMSLPGAKGTR